MLRIEDLHVAYGPVTALRGVSLDVPDGSLTAVLGANGAGKTTLLRTISGLLRPRAGVMTYGTVDLKTSRAEEMTRHGIAHVPEGRGVIDELTVEENLRLGAIALRQSRRDVATALTATYDMFTPLGPRRGKPAHTLSGGERQMLAIGRALMGKPKLLLLDEPSLGLAPLITAQIMAMLRQLREADGLTVLLVEQNARSALSVADWGVVLNVGAVVARGDATTIAADDDLRHAYLGF